MSEREILVPDLGGFKDVLIIDVLVKPGDRVGADTPLLTLETDKATMDVPAGAAGVITRLLVKNGGVVSEGTAIAVLKAEAEDAQAAAATPAQGRARGKRAGGARRREGCGQQRTGGDARGAAERDECHQRELDLHRRMRVRACAALRASWASISRACAARVAKGALSKVTLRPTSRER